MRKYICILIIVLNTSVASVFAHTDWTYMGSFGNVRTSITTGFRYEKINKVAIFGQLAEKLSREMNYTGLIHLNFIHHYIRNVIPHSFIAYDYIGHWNADLEQWQTRRGIVIRQFAREFDAETTLKLLEYAISNRRNIRRTQERYVYNRQHRQMEFYTIATSRIDRMLDSPNSRLLNRMMQQRVDRQEEKFIDGISYFWQNNRYHIFMKYRRWNREMQSIYYAEYVLFDVKNVYDFHRFRNWSAIIFDTDSSFYAVRQSVYIPFGNGSSFPDVHKPQISKRHVIENTLGNFIPFNVHSIGGNKVSIHFQEGTWGRERVLLYLVEDDVLIQDLDKLIRESRVDRNDNGITENYSLKTEN